MSTSDHQIFDTDADAITGLAAGEAQLQQLIKMSGKQRHRRSPVATGGVQLVPADGGGAKKRQKKTTQQMVIQPPMIPQQMNQQQMLHQQIMQQQFQEQLYQQHDQQLMRQIDRSSLPLLLIDPKTMGRADHSGLLEQLLRQLQLQPPVMLKEPDVSIASHQFLHQNLKPGFLDVDFSGTFGSARSACLPGLDYYFGPPFVPPPWTPKLPLESSGNSMTPYVQGKDVPTLIQPLPFVPGDTSDIPVVSRFPSSFVTTSLAIPFTIAPASHTHKLVTSVLNRDVRPLSGTTKSPSPLIAEANLSDRSH